MVGGGGRRLHYRPPRGRVPGQSGSRRQNGLHCAPTHTHEIRKPPSPRPPTIQGPAQIDCIAPTHTHSESEAPDPRPPVGSTPPPKMDCIAPTHTHTKNRL